MTVHTPVLRSLDEVKTLGHRRSAVTLGVFDGVHIGHRRIVEKVTRARRSDDIDSAFLITFDPHPVVVTHSKMTPPMLTTIDERVKLLDEFGLDGIVVLEFNEQLANVDYKTFIRKYLSRPFDMRLLVLGYDCRFGRNREGGPDTAREEATRQGFDLKVIEAERNGDEIVSSTKIRNALIEGDLEQANRLLGHPYLVSGTVVRGQGRGRGLGFPTANLSVADPYKLWPGRGVYAVTVDHDGRLYGGMLNLGRAPTMKSLAEDARELEVHLFDFDRDLYGAHLDVHFHRYLRGEKKFPSPEALARQLERDKSRAVAYLQKLA